MFTGFEGNGKASNIPLGSFIARNRRCSAAGHCGREANQPGLCWDLDSIRSYRKRMNKSWSQGVSLTNGPSHTRTGPSGH
ncbi:unnamed protein product [Cochlearia groenlandica]